MVDCRYEEMILREGLNDEIMKLILGSFLIKKFDDV